MNRGFHIENFMGLQLQRGLIGSTEHTSRQTFTFLDKKCNFSSVLLQTNEIYLSLC